ncbi:LGFP repeat-containing protein, partial [Arthrobacter sp. NPDC057259]|uniref:LGFP repeat-containing protein n=1 Tax=Arthrobacter sp. NPDC057259 TaxID=3346073 RepID=UPI00363D1B31
TGPIRDTWAATRYETGPLAYPTTPVTCGLVNDGCYQNFQNGAIIWSPTTGAQPSPNGPIRDTWQKTGYERGTLGYPTTPQTCGLKDGGCYQNFQNGAIIWSPATGAFSSQNGPVRDSWKASGFERGSLGYPTSEQTCGLKDSGCYQNYQNGAIIWSPTTGAQISPTGPIRDTWAANGYERGTLGYPTSPITCTPTEDTCTQTYQNGLISWTTGAGTTITRP